MLSTNMFHCMFLLCLITGMFGTQLVYKFEGIQYAEIPWYPDVSRPQVYGVLYLLRLFVRIEEVLACVSLDENYCIIVGIFTWLPKISGKKFCTLFTASDYEVASPEYHSKALWGCTDPRVMSGICKHFLVLVFSLHNWCCLKLLAYIRGYASIYFLFCFKQKIKECILLSSFQVS
jgi:hypothetical protein